MVAAWAALVRKLQAASARAVQTAMESVRRARGEGKNTGQPPIGTVASMPLPPLLSAADLRSLAGPADRSYAGCTRTGCSLASRVPVTGACDIGAPGHDDCGREPRIWREP